ncbi:DNA polymerase III subunit alpha [Ureibacillus sinduriensis]|uniref:DNA-directed DNA polymerase n=1 Tax=Ureibacillus sinduriensis BLB-1 = JCM 15800 TaxID=1384057 RepID=A0A0A3HWK2_9BACL|nr:DNA polymerase III subunit alpha [Ureibacillus sinduriensis]KGR76779.1 DNA polymerase III subunit epsilon [Ureibacillus sinduriensis BLB-1 = JCM 15800]
MTVVYPQIRTSADLLKSTIRMEELIPFLQSQKAIVCAMVNTKLYGLLPFWYTMKKNGIHPVIGLSIMVELTDEISLPLIIYAKDNDGYKNLLKISSSISIRKDEKIPWRWLAAYSKGCAAVISTESEQWFSESNVGFVEQVAETFQFDFYFGIARSGGIISPIEQRAMHLSQVYNIKCIATHECLFLYREDHFAYKVARAIETGVKLNEAIHSPHENKFVPTAAEWQDWYQDQPQLLENSRHFLLNCRVDLSYDQHFMPKFPLESGQTSATVLAEMAMSGLRERLQTNTPNEQYVNRLQYELQVIISMGYADYFLIVADFMNFAKDAKVLTGPGRGSSASSLVAYCLNITQVDPLKYGLLFERFLNPERITLPDIDIDFVDTKRQEVIQYVANKYGKQYVAQIITFGTLSAKAVARDVARMFNFESETLAMISKLIPNKTGITLQEVYATSEGFRKWVEAEEIRKTWFTAAKKLEGLPRNASTHAAGVVLSPMPLVEVVPIEEGHDGIYLTQWPMQEVEQVGLLKMDFLGLRNLTILENIRQSIYYTHKKWIDFDQIPLNDEKTFQLLRNGDTTGIFQLESDGMKNALRVIAPTEFLDIVAVNALYRPGPMEFIPVYARRKAKQERVGMPHPVLEPILKETYGVIVYQEQIMQIAHIFAGFTIGQADLLRRAVSKKKREVMEQQQQAFVNGAISKGYPESIAKEVYDLIVRFADYGFPKSHAVAYSIISYQMAYLKANYPANFYAALMTNATGNHEKLFQLILEAKNKGIAVLKPSIRKSQRFFTVEEGKIRFSLSAIKGVPQPFLQKIIAIRKSKEQPFEDIFDLAVSLSAVHFTRKVIEPLVKSGALDDFGKDRATLLATIEAAGKHASLVRPNEEDNDLFTTDSLIFGKPKYVEAHTIPEKMKLQFEKEALGFYLSEHPVALERAKWQDVNATTKGLDQARSNSFIKFVGMVESIRQIRTKKGELMAFIQLQDEYGSISATLFPQSYNEVIGWIKEDRIVRVEGILEQRNGNLQIKVKTMEIGQ